MVGVSVILVEDEDVFLCGSLFERRRDEATTTKANRSRTEDDAKITSTAYENDTVAFVDEVVDVVVAMDNGDDGDGVLEASRSASALASSTEEEMSRPDGGEGEAMGWTGQRYGPPWSVVDFGKTWRLEVGKLRAHRCGR